MADWYCSSVKWSAVTVKATTTAYVIGDLRRENVPAVGSERVFRCTTAGTSAGSAPTMNLGTGATTTDGTVVWTEVTGNPTYNWSAPFARLSAALARAAAADRVVLGHDNADTQSGISNLAPNGTLASPQTVITVSTAGSVPPVAADLVSVPTASVASTGVANIIFGTYCYYQGIIFSSQLAMTWTQAAADYRFDACSFQSNTTNAFDFSSSTHQNLDFNNSSFVFQAVGHTINWAGGVWRMSNGSACTGGTYPTTMFTLTNVTHAGLMDFDGVDFSMLTSGKTIWATANAGETKINCRNCKFDSGVTLYGGSAITRGSELNFFNCEGVPSNNLRISYPGTKSKETTIVRTGGASDGVETISWKVATTANDNAAFPFECFPIVIWNATVGTPVTATIEIVNDGTTLTNADAWIAAEYLGTSSSNLASGISGAVAFPGAATTNLTTSTETWMTTGLSSPIKQKLTVTFTAQKAGLVRLTVKIAKASKTLYVCPKAAVA